MYVFSSSTYLCNLMWLHNTGYFINPSRISDLCGTVAGMVMPGREHVNRGTDTPSFCLILQVLDVSTLGDTANVNPVIKFLLQTLQLCWNFMYHS
jgi:hypothetical protein